MVPGEPFQLEEEIGRGANSVVFRATRGEQQLAVKIQRASAREEDPESVLRLRREAALLACLQHPALPRIHAVGESDGRPHLVREYIAGRTLASALEEGPLPEPLIVSIGSDIAGALGEVHRHGLVHRDVKPRNILLDAQGHARLIDFGFATRAVPLAAGIEQDEIAGTLMYSAPEQTGMLKRPLDGRSDLYSLGVVLFECATGRLPFLAAEVGEVVRLHAVAPPPEVQSLRPGITPALARILSKLLAKDPDDRYQTGDALVGDLQQLSALNEAIRTGQRIELGAGAAGRLSEDLLIGRESEFSALRDRWSAALKGQGSVVLVEGAAGQGKSRLVEELARKARASGALVLTGKCVRADPTPFAPLRQALDPHRQRIVDVAGPAAPLLRRLSPALADLLRDTPDVPEPVHQPEQFVDALAELLLRLAPPGTPALLFVDDVQWLDEGSRQVLLRLAARVKEAPLLIVAASRNDADSAERLGRIAHDLGAGLSARITVEPLGEDAVARVAMAQLGGRQLAPGVARQLVARTRGNPFAVGEYVRAMVDQGILCPVWDEWQVDAERLEQVNLPTDVLDLVVQRLEWLDPQARSVLAAAAVIGSRFNPALLPSVCQADETAVIRALTAASEAHLIEHTAGRTYGFVHDRVRDALLTMLANEELPDLHQRIAEALEAVDEGGPDVVYARARHFALGRIERDPRRAYLAQLQAGRAAQAAYADEDAHAFLSEACAIAERAGLEVDREHEEAMGSACARTGRFPEAVSHLERALSLTTDPFARSRLRMDLVVVHQARVDTVRAWDECQQAYRELGVGPPRNSARFLLVALVEWLIALVLGRFPMRPAQGARREKLALLARLYELTTVLGAFNMHPLGILFGVGLRALFRGRLLGPSRAMVNSEANYALTLGAIGRVKASERQGDRAIRIARALGDPTALGHAHLMQSLGMHCAGAAREAEKRTRATLEEHGRWLDGMDYVNGCGDLAWNLTLRGYCREAWQWMEKARSRLENSPGLKRHPMVTHYAASLLAVLGRPAEAAAAHEEAWQAAPRGTRARFLWADLLAHSVLFHVEQGSLGEPLERILAEHPAMGLRPDFVLFHMRHFYVFQSQARLAQCLAAGDSERPQRLAQLAQAQKLLRRAANVPTLRCHYLVIEAARRRLSGDRRAAFRLLDRAEAIARDCDSPWALFEAARERAHLLTAEGNHGAARREARAAQALAVEHGWTSRLRRLRTEFPLSDVAHRGEGSVSASTSGSSRTSSLRLKRCLDALVEVSLASVLDPDRQTRFALDEIVRLLGAERAFLFLQCDDANLRLQAARDANGTELKAAEGYSRSVIEEVRNRRQPLVLSGTDNGSVLTSESMVAHGLRSILAAPLLLRERLLGVIYLDTRLARGMFTEDDVQILLAMANHIAIALETARVAQVELERATQARRLEEQAILLEVSRVANSSLELGEVLEEIAHQSARACRAAHCHLFLLDPSGERVELVMSQSDAPDVACAQVPPDSRVQPLERIPLLQQVIQSRDAVIHEHARVQTEIPPAWLPLFADARMMVVPLQSREQLLGVMVLGYQDCSEEAIRGHTYLALTIAGHVSGAITNARMFGQVTQLATTDELTGAFNRRQLLVRGEGELRLAADRGQPVSVMIFDVDHFKHVNDTWGHLPGDQVLRTLVARCRKVLRDEDVLGRFGGEEFVVILPSVGMEEASGIAERLRECVAATPIPSEAGDIPVTISLGVACATSPGEKLAALLERADAALYSAKESGRNRVERAA